MKYQITYITGLINEKNELLGNFQVMYTYYYHNGDLVRTASFLTASVMLFDEENKRVQSEFFKEEQIKADLNNEQGLDLIIKMLEETFGDDNNVSLEVHRERFRIFEGEDSMKQLNTTFVHNQQKQYISVLSEGGFTNSSEVLYKTGFRELYNAHLK